MSARLAAIKNFDILNGNGLGVSIWYAGCPFACEGCHNKEFWCMNTGYLLEEQHYELVERLLSNEAITNLSILGGEPLLKRNYTSLERFIAIANKLNKEVWLWTGFEYEDIKHLEFLTGVTYLIDGKYDINQHEITRYKGSKNQKIYKLK